jgi:hypothetical protein
VEPLNIASIRLHKGGRRVAVTDSDKDTSLLQHGINYNRKSFMIQAPGVKVIKVFHSPLMLWTNKLECLSIESLISLA